MRFSRTTVVNQYSAYQYRKPYGCLGFLGDVFMICITCGFWLVWIFVREMRRR